MNRSVWDDDKCNEVWKHLVKDVPYDWDLKSRKVATRKLLDILQIEQLPEDQYLNADIVSARGLRRLIGSVLRGDDEEKAISIGKWVVSSWGGITAGLDSVPSWITELRPFSVSTINNFIERIKTDRISSWSKIIAFADFDNHIIYDSRTAVALNAAMVMSKTRPVFYMPPSKSKQRQHCVKSIKAHSDDLSSGYEVYRYVLGRFVELGLTDSILEAERMIFAGADQTGINLMASLQT